MDNPQLALYRFSNALPGSACRDAITGATVRFPMALYVPPVQSTAINPVSLLTVPAADDPTVARRYNGRPSDGRAPHFLWTHAYKLFGYDATELGVSGGCARARAWPPCGCLTPCPPRCWDARVVSAADRSVGVFAQRSRCRCPHLTETPPTLLPIITTPIWPQVDFLTYIGDALTLGKPIAAALMGTSSQVRREGLVPRRRALWQDSLALRSPAPAAAPLQLAHFNPSLTRPQAPLYTQLHGKHKHTHTHTQVMAIDSSSIEMMEPLLGSQASVDDIAAAVVAATYAKVNATWTEAGDGSPAMSDAPTLSDLYSEVGAPGY